MGKKMERWEEGGNVVDAHGQCTDGGARGIGVVVYADLSGRVIEACRYAVGPSKPLYTQKRVSRKALASCVEPTAPTE